MKKGRSRMAPPFCVALVMLLMPKAGIRGIGQSCRPFPVELRLQQSGFDVALDTGGQGFILGTFLRAQT